MPSNYRIDFIRVLGSFAGLLFLLQISLAEVAFSQPNGDFESWSGGLPTNWLGPMVPGAVTQTTDAHGGLYAVSVASQVPLGDTEVAPATLMTGEFIPPDQFFEGFPILRIPEEDPHPKGVTGWYKFTSAGGDALFVITEVRRGGILVGSDSIIITEPTNEYRQFTSTLNYWSSDTPDTAVIYIAAGNPLTEQGTVGTKFTIDDIALIPGNAVAEARRMHVEVFPNPATDKIFLALDADRRTSRRVELVNALGRTVLSHDVARETSGTSESISLQSLVPGIYFYRVRGIGEEARGIIRVVR